MDVCIKCGVVLTESNWKSACSNNYVYKCDDCIRAEKREYQRKWRFNNPEECKIRLQRYKLKLSETDPIKKRAISAYSDCRKRAIKTGLDFDLDTEFIVSLMRRTKTCPYIGWELTYISNKSKTLASIDRIDSSRGYTKDNIQVVSYLANLMKSNSTIDELIAFAHGALRTVEKIKAAA